VGWIPDSVKGLCNSVHLMNCTLRSLPLDGPLPTPDRSGTFLLSNLGPADTGAAIQKLFVASGLGSVAQIWLQNNTFAPAGGAPGAGASAREGAGDAERRGQSEGQRNGRARRRGGAAGAAKGFEQTRDGAPGRPKPGAQVPEVLTGCAPHLAVTPWDHIPAPLLHACLNAGTSFQAALTPGSAGSAPARQAGLGGGVRARAESGGEESRPAKALRTEGPAEGRSSCSIM